MTSFIALSPKYEVNYPCFSLRRLGIRVYHSNDLIGPNRPKDLFYCSFIQIYHSNDLIGPNKAQDLFYRTFTQVRDKLFLFFHYVDLEYEVITQMTYMGPIGPKTSFKNLLPKYEVNYPCSFTTST